MFNLNPAPTFKAAVQLTVPGQPEPAQVEFVFRHKGKDALAKWWADYVQTPTVDALALVIEGWSVRRDGEPVPFAPAVLDELIQNYPAAQGEIADAYMLELVRSRRKN